VTLVKIFGVKGKAAMEAENFAARRLDDLPVRDNSMLQRAIYLVRVI
jgi:hypothetical protein